MIVYNENFEPITDYDLDLGYIISTLKPKTENPISRDDYEEEPYNVYYKYNEEELRKIKQAKVRKEKEEQKEIFLETAPDRIDDIELNQEDIILLLADMIGMSEEEEE